MKLRIPLLLLLTSLCPPLLLAAEADDASKIEFFEKKIRPLLADKC